MNFNLSSLANLVPVLYRWLILGALVAAFGGFCYLKGAEHEMARSEKIEQVRQQNELRLGHLRQAVNEKIITKYLPALTKIQTITQTIVEKVTEYVPTDTPPLPGSFRVYLDAAALGKELPDPARVSDAAPVSAQDVARTVAENYGGCLKNEQLILGWQEWETKQGAVK